MVGQNPSVASRILERILEIVHIDCRGRFALKTSRRLSVLFHQRLALAVYVRGRYRWESRTFGSCPDSRRFDLPEENGRTFSILVR